MTEFFENPIWQALTTDQIGFARRAGAAARFEENVLPFAGLAEQSFQALSNLATLMTPGESLYLRADGLPAHEQMQVEGVVPCWQMHLPQSFPLSPDAPAESLRELHPITDAAAMVQLTALAFPGFFRAETPRVGRYFGIFAGHALVAMAGERLALPGWRELSAVCTHPAHTGAGHARTLVQHLLTLHQQEGLRSMLHVTTTNYRALNIYERLGFRIAGDLRLARLIRR